MKRLLLNILLILPLFATSQAIPSKSENIANLMTFSREAPSAWGDDDNVQTFFVFIPFDHEEPFYIRIFDPNIGGKLDAAYGDRVFNSTTKFSIYGGKGAHSDPDARKINPIGNYRSGKLLDSKTFDGSDKYDMKWFSFGPLDPVAGEYDEKLKGYLFKILAEGVEGNDGNLYSYFISRKENDNQEINGANAFTYEYTFRLKYKGNVAHFYPFIDDEVIAIKQYNFDLDKDGKIKIYSTAKNGHNGEVSGDDMWNSSIHQITEKEKNKCMDIQIHRDEQSTNDVSLYVLNQYDEAVKFFSSPLGTHKYVYQFNVKPKD
ncbi:MAG: hypothetical protein HKN39_05465 [Flavobacteriales bacterium]|nr:hypothetical protein [Flavobacteriales bacterium]